MFLQYLYFSTSFGEKKSIIFCQDKRRLRLKAVDASFVFGTFNRVKQVLPLTEGDSRWLTVGSIDVYAREGTGYPLGFPNTL